MSGYLKRRQPRSGRWKRWWFVLKDKVLYTYKASEDTVAVETMPVLGWTLETLADVSRACSITDGCIHINNINNQLICNIIPGRRKYSLC